MNKPIGFIEMEVDESSLFILLDDIAEHVNGMPNEKLKQFIRNAFHVTNDTAEGARDLTHLVFKPDARYLDLLPALRAGDISFGSLCDILTPEIGVGNETDHG